MPATVPTKLESAPVDELYLDPKNPRLGEEEIQRELTQPELLKEMQQWELEELAVSFLETGFWTYEPLIVVREMLDGERRLVVIEGNRRLATLKLLEKLQKGEQVPSRFRKVVEGFPIPSELLESVPYLSVETRSDVQAFIGFRHVSGIKQWKPAEKAAFMATLLEEQDKSYEEVARLFGSKPRQVRQTYIAYRILRQMLDHDVLDIEDIGRRFSVMDRAIQDANVREFLGINLELTPEEALEPIDVDHEYVMPFFADILFGRDGADPILPDSRQIKQLGLILDNQRARSYLEKADAPSWSVAVDLASADVTHIEAYLIKARDSITLALPRAHLYREHGDISDLVEEVASQAVGLAASFPAALEKIRKLSKE
jgi:hypothetical protein